MSWLDVLKIGAAALDVGATVKQVGATVKNEKEFRRSHEETAAAVSWQLNRRKISCGAIMEIR